jgi:nicotinamide riboside kinase
VGGESLSSEGPAFTLVNQTWYPWTIEEQRKKEFEQLRQDAAAHLKAELAAVTAKLEEIYAKGWEDLEDEAIAAEEEVEKLLEHQRALEHPEYE